MNCESTDFPTDFDLNSREIMTGQSVQVCLTFARVEKPVNSEMYGNTGCGVFKGGIQNWKEFWLKTHCSQMKSFNFANWLNGEVSKRAKI